MKVRVIWAIAGLAIALILAACGGTTTAQCPQQANTSPGTVSAGQVSIATDHSVYAPGDTIEATITNHLPTTVVVNNDRFTARCPYFVPQLQVGNDWQDRSACNPIGGDTQPHNAQQRIAAGASFRSFVGLPAAPTTGTYRLWISSYSIGDAQGRAAGVGTAESATFRVCACRVCA